MSRVHVCMWVEYDIEADVFGDDWSGECNTVLTDLAQDRERKNLFVKMDNVDFVPEDEGP